MRPEEVAPARRLRRMDITIREAAPLLGRSPRAIRARIARGELPARRQGHTWVLPLEHLPLTAAQRASMLGRADDARAAVEQALPSRLASTRARKHRSVLDLDSFRTAREVLLEIAKTPEPDLGIVCTHLRRALDALAAGTHEFARELRARHYRAARGRVSRAIARLLTTATFDEPRRTWCERLEGDVLPRLGGLLRWMEAERTGRK
jgi:hypothetical protein